MSNETIVKVFDYAAQAVRVEVVDGELWFVAKDVLSVLEYADGYNPSRALEHVPPQWKGVHSMHTLGGVQEILCLSEQGLYFFLARSDKPRALPLQMFVAGTVLPSIRKTGKFEVMPADPTALGLPDFNDPFAAAEAWAKEGRGRVAAEAQVKQLAAKVEADAPRVAFAAAVEASPTSYLVGQVAKTIKLGTGLPIGQNRLFAWFRNNGWMHKEGSQKNDPTQRAIDMGLMTVQERTRTTPDGSVLVTRTPRITGKGRLYFYGKFHAQALRAGLPSLPVPPEAPAQLGLAMGPADADDFDADEAGWPV